MALDQRSGIQTRTDKGVQEWCFSGSCVGSGVQNSLSKGSAMGLSQAHLRAEKRLGMTSVEGEGGPQLFRTGQALRSYPVPQPPLSFCR